MTGVGTRNESTRTKWLERTLQEVAAGVRILDAGAGEGRYRRFCSHLDYVSQDFAQYNGVGDGRGLQTGSWDQNHLDLVCDICAIPEPDASFDAVMCIEVLEHLPYPVLAIKEFSRLLKPGGRLIVTAPFCSLTHFAPYHYYTGFSRYFYEKHLVEEGFVIDEITENGNYFEYLAQEIRRVPEVAQRYSNSFPNWWERRALGMLLKMLQRFSCADTGSAELLHFNYLVSARKRQG